jgi:hypothetical protein
VVGRENELAQMQEWLAKAREGIRQVVFVSGEAGIGKTAIVTSFLATVVARQGVAVVARRTDAARLMILGTYRPIEMLTNGNPLRPMKEELEFHRQCVDLRLPLLGEKDVAAYLVRRFANGSHPGALSFRAQRGVLESFDRLAPMIHTRTEGNPLFMVNVVDYLDAQGPLLDADKIEAPRSIRQMIERNFDRLSADERRVLQAASVAGVQFSAASIAAAVERPIAEIEECCTGPDSRTLNNAFEGKAPANGPTEPSRRATAFCTRSIRKCFMNAHPLKAGRKRIAGSPRGKRRPGVRAWRRSPRNSPITAAAAATSPKH